MAEPALPTGWDWLEAVTAVPSPAAGSPEDQAAAFSRCFAGADWQRVLATLKAMTLERALGPDAPEAALRHLEGQRVLVATILSLIARGGRA